MEVEPSEGDSIQRGLAQDTAVCHHSGNIRLETLDCFKKTVRRGLILDHRQAEFHSCSFHRAWRQPAPASLRGIRPGKDSNDFHTPARGSESLQGLNCHFRGTGKKYSHTCLL